MKTMCDVFAACLLLAACGCSSVPRYATRTVIPQLDFDQTPPREVLTRLAAAIRQCNPAAPPVRLDPTPTRISRPTESGRLAGEMDEIERRYRKSMTAWVDSPVSLHVRDVTVRDACRCRSEIMWLRVAFQPREIVFRVGPETAAFRAYAATLALIDALKTYPDVGWHCFERPPPWNETRMMSVDNGMRILFLGSEEEHAEFTKDLRTWPRRAFTRVPRE